MAARDGPPRSSSRLRISRTVRAERGSDPAHGGPGHYTDRTATPGGRPFDIGDGERSILRTIPDAIDAARTTIMIENQALPIPEVATRLEAVLNRGVEVALLVPAAPEEHVRSARRDPAKDALFAGIEALERHETFLLAGLSVTGEENRHSVYVHAKAMLVDDAWATLARATCIRIPFGDTEMNASFWDESVVRALRWGLLQEHLDEDTSLLDDRASLRRYREVARANALKRRNGSSDLQGLALALDPTTYGRGPV